MTIQILKINERATFYKVSPLDSGYDLTGCSYNEVEEGRWMVGLGVIVKPHSDTYFEIVPRSSFCKLPFIMPNGVGVIDQHYRGEWKFPVRFLRENKDREKTDYYIRKYLIGKRIAQALVRPIYNLEVEEMPTDYEFPTTQRGKAGFGSTGK